MSIFLIVATSVNYDKNNYNEEGRVEGWKYWSTEQTKVVETNQNMDKVTNGETVPSHFGENFVVKNEPRNINPWWERIVSNRH